MVDVVNSVSDNFLMVGRRIGMGEARAEGRCGFVDKGGGVSEGATDWFEEGVDSRRGAVDGVGLE